MNGLTYWPIFLHFPFTKTVKPLLHTLKHFHAHHMILFFDFRLSKIFMLRPPSGQSYIYFFAAAKNQNRAKLWSILQFVSFTAPQSLAVFYYHVSGQYLYSLQRQESNNLSSPKVLPKWRKRTLMWITASKKWENIFNKFLSW